MNAHEVIKGVEHFFQNVVSKAKSCGDWSEDNVSNALHWAQFCEQVYRVYKGTIAQKKLDELIHSNIVSCKKIRSLCFEDLGQSFNILYEAFSKNPIIENEKLVKINEKINNEQNVEKNLKNYGEIDNLCFELVEALKPLKLVDSERSLYYEVKAEIYLNLLKESTIHLTSEDEVEKFLSSALEKLIEDKNELELLLHILSLGVPKDSESSIIEIQEFAINWTILNLLSEKKGSSENLFWNNASILRAISTNSQTFLNFYLDYITNYVASFSCELDDGEMKWMPNSTDSYHLSFDNILTHFRHMLNDDDEVSESTKKYLLNLLNRYPDVQIYKEIFTRVT